MSIPQGIKRVICLLLAVCFIGQNTLTCYGQALIPTLTPQALNFNPPTLKYLSVNSANPYNYFNFLLDKGSKAALANSGAGLEQEAKKLIHYFFIGLTLPESSLWVNLRPDEPGRITSLELAQTDMGRLLLEQDLRLKKDVAQCLNPKQPIGKRFWEELYIQAELLLGKGKLKKTAITTSNRVWIVPDEAVVMETEDGALVTQAKLKVLLESEYISLKAKSWNKEVEVQVQNKDQLKNLTEQLMKTIIISEIAKEVNSGKNYAPLRQIYHSLILAQWFKQKYNKQKKDGKDIPYIEAIDQSWLKGLESEFPWSKDAIWREYLTSFQKGEYQLKEKLAGLNRMYTSGGILLGGSEKYIRIEPRGGVSSPLMQDSDSIPIITQEDSANTGRSWPSQITPVSAASPLTEQPPFAASSPLEQEDRDDSSEVRERQEARGKLNDLLRTSNRVDINVIKRMDANGSLYKAIPELRALLVESNDPGHTAKRRIDHVFDALEFFEGLSENVLNTALDDQGNKIKEGLVSIRNKIGQNKNDLYLLRLAILLHDVGKRPEKKPLDPSHEERGAADVLPLILGRIENLTEEDKETISYLVEHHSAFSFFGNNRDSSEEAKDNLVVEAADVLGDDLKRIEMLYLLNVADFVALDAKEKKNSSIGLLLLEIPFKSISDKLSEEGGLEKARKRAEEEYLQGIFPEYGEKIKEIYLGLVGLPFIAGASFKQIVGHISLLGDVLQGEANVKTSKLVYYDNTQYTELVVGVPQDKRGLLRLLTGFLVDRGYDIHLAWINTVEIDDKKVVFDRFLIKRASGQNDDGLGQELVSEINSFIDSGKINLDMDGIKQKLPELTNSEVKIDFEKSDDGKIKQMTIKSKDVMGLLFRITDVLSESGINLRKAIIKTWGSDVGNIFFIEDENGNLLEEESANKLRVKLERELTVPERSSSSPLRDDIWDIGSARTLKDLARFIVVRHETGSLTPYIIQQAHVMYAELTEKEVHRVGKNRKKEILEEFLEEIKRIENKELVVVSDEDRPSFRMREEFLLSDGVAQLDGRAYAVNPSRSKSEQERIKLTVLQHKLREAVSQFVSGKVKPQEIIKTVGKMREIKLGVYNVPPKVVTFTAEEMRYLKEHIENGNELVLRYIEYFVHRRDNLINEMGSEVTDGNREIFITDLKEIMKWKNTGLTQVEVYSHSDLVGVHVDDLIEFLGKDKDYVDRIDILRPPLSDTIRIEYVRREGKATSLQEQVSSSPMENDTSLEDYRVAEYGGIDLSQIEVTLKDEKFVSQLNPVDLKVLRAAKYLKEGWGSLSLLYVHEIMLLLKDNLANDIKQKGLLQEVLKQLQVKGFVVPEIRLAVAG